MHGGRGAEPDVARVRPLRVLSKRPGELLCRLSEDTLDWVDVESVDLEGVMVAETQEQLAPEITDIGTWIRDGIPFQEVYGPALDV